MKYYLKLLSFRDHPTLKILDDKEVKDKIWSSGVFKKPFVLRAKEICRKWNIKFNTKTETKVISNIPPWKKLKLEVHFDLNSKIQVHYSDIVINKIFLETIRSYDNDIIEIYTDGSKMFEDETKVAAAFIIPKEIIMEKFRLNPSTSVLGAELYAIEMALVWISNNKAGGKFLILTDSKSSLFLINNKAPKTHQETVMKIQELSYENFCNGGRIIFQWVPGHSGIKGNELVDRYAKQGLNENKSMNNVIDLSENYSMLKRSMKKRWQEEWNTVKDSLFIGPIKGKIGDWKWAYSKDRGKETIMAKLRCGCARVNKYQYTIKQSLSPNCDQCGVEEDIDHFLLYCRKYSQLRISMENEIRKLKILI